MKPEDVHLAEVLFEFRIIGNFVRVSAIDTRTNTEISMVGDPKAGEELLKRMAMRKLRYVIAKNAPKPPSDGSIIA